MRTMRTKLPLRTFLAKTYTTEPALKDDRSKKVAEFYYKKGMTQHEIAESMNISQATVSRALLVGMK